MRYKETWRQGEIQKERIAAADDDDEAETEKNEKSQ